MNRNEFLRIIWKKGFRPILLLTIIYFCVKFWINVFQEDGTERFFIILLLGLAILIATVYLLKMLFKSIVFKINSKLPESVKIWIRIIDKSIKYFSPIFLGIIIYHCWETQGLLIIFLVGTSFLQKLIEIIEEERQTIIGKIKTGNNNTYK